MNIFRKIAELKESGVPFVLATLVGAEGSTPRKAGARMLVFPDGSIVGTVGGGTVERLTIPEAVALLKSGSNESKKLTYNCGKGGALRLAETRTGMLCGGKVEVLIEPFQPEFKLVICGGGHIGEKLAALGDALEVPYAVVDSRRAFANRKRFPRAEAVVCAEFTKGIQSLSITARTAVVIVTFGHRHDDVCLRAALATPAAYIGLIGSRKKAGVLLRRLAKAGFNPKEKRLHSPVGLDIGSETPAEIALSIMAEIFKERTGGTGRPMRER